MIDNNFFKAFKETHGAMSVCESLALISIAELAPKGTYISLGSHKGKDTIAATQALKDGEMYLVDPIFEDIDLAKEVIKVVGNNVKSRINIYLKAEYSTDAIKKYAPYAYVFLDTGDHGEELVSTEVRLLEDTLIHGGIIAMHDFGNQFTAVARGYDYLLSTGKYEAIEVDWDTIFDYVRSNNLEEGNSSWHERGSEEFPKFIGALRRK